MHLINIITYLKNKIRVQSYDLFGGGLNQYFVQTFYAITGSLVLPMFHK